MDVIHMTNPEFAGRVGITRSMASRLRSGSRRPSVRLAETILRELAPDRYEEGMAAFAQSGAAQREFFASIAGPIRADEDDDG